MGSAEQTRGWRTLIKPSTPNVAPLQPATREFLIRHGMPSRVDVEFQCEDGTHAFSFAFAALSAPIVRLTSTVDWGDFYDAELERVWSNYWTLGEIVSINRRASLCIDGTDGSVFEVDVEMGHASLINSAAESFEHSLRLVRDWSAPEGVTGPRDFSHAGLLSLSDALSSADPAVFAEERNYWPSLLAYLSTSALAWMDVTDDPQRFKDRF